MMGGAIGLLTSWLEIIHRNSKIEILPMFHTSNRDTDDFAACLARDPPLLPLEIGAVIWSSLPCQSVEWSLVEWHL